MNIDIALTEVDGQVVVHCADCPEARRLADAGFPVATLYGCARLPDDLPFHRCLTDLLCGVAS